MKYITDISELTDGSMIECSNGLYIVWNMRKDEPLLPTKFVGDFFNIRRNLFFVNFHFQSFFNYRLIYKNEKTDTE